MVQAVSTTGTQRSKPWKYEIGEFQPWFRFQRGLVTFFFFFLGISWNFSTNGCLEGLESLYVIQRVVSSVLYHFSIISPISLLFSLSITFIYSLSSIKRAKVENLYDPGSPCSSSPFADCKQKHRNPLFLPSQLVSSTCLVHVARWNSFLFSFFFLYF